MVNDYRNYRIYIDGNTVKRDYVAAVPAKKPVRKQKPKNEPVKEKKVKEKVKVVYQTANRGFVLTIACAMVVVVLLSIQLIKLQAEAYASNKKISTISNEITMLAADNDAKELDIDGRIDYQSVYDRAVELGMVHVNSEQIINYDRETLEYVKQYKTVPTTK